MFTGGSQIALVGVLGGGGSGVAAVATSTLLGLRNGLYGLQLSRLLGLTGWRRLLGAQLTIDESLKITREVAEGLELADDQNLVHPDIKPANIWLESGRTGGDPHVKLLDFGIARLLESQSRLTAEGRIVGTPSYLSPEQAYNETVDGRSDLFSLGCVFYAMLTGNSPFERGNTILSVQAALRMVSTARSTSSSSTTTSIFTLGRKLTAYSAPR